MMLNIKHTWLYSAIGIVVFCAMFAFLGTQVNTARPHEDIDSKAHISRAELFMKTGSYVENGTTTVPPIGFGYAWFIIVVYSLFGHSLNAVVLVQLLLAIMNFFIIRAICSELFSKNAGLIGFLLGCGSIGYIVFAQFILTEILLATFLAGSFLCMLKQHQSQNALFAGLIMGLSIFVKPVALYIVIPLAIVWGLQHKKNAFFFLCCFLGGAGVVKMHNYLLFGSASFGNLASWNLAYAYNSYFLAYENGTNHDVEYMHLVERTGGDIKPELLMPELMRKMLHNPLGAGWCWLFNMFKTTLGLYSTNMKVLIGSAYSGEISFFKIPGNLLQKIRGYVTGGGRESWIICVGIYEAFFIIISYLSAIIGVWSLWSEQKKRSYVLLIILYAGYFVAITGHDGCARYRMMVEFLLLSCAAGGIDYVLRSIKKSKGYRY
jgi:hypothetical protein